jgi:hypothetical protein
VDFFPNRNVYFIFFVNFGALWYVLVKWTYILESMARHDIAEILLTLALNTNQSINQSIGIDDTHMPFHPTNCLFYWTKVPITTKVVNSNPVHGEVYSIQHCDKVCQWLTAGRWVSPDSSTNKTHRHDIAEILLKVVLNQPTCGWYTWGLILHRFTNCLPMVGGSLRVLQLLPPLKLITVI